MKTLSILQKHRLPILLHIVAWMLFFIIPGIMNAEPNPGPPGGLRPAPMYHTQAFWAWFSTLKNVLLVPLFYLNVYYILPKLLGRQRYVLLLLIEAVLGLMMFGWTESMSAIVFPGTHGGPHRYIGIVGFLIILSIAVGFYFYREAVLAEALRKERETESLKTELQFLRWQISPHFLFNALNNTVSLARKKSDLLEPMLISISGLMRYMLYEAAEAMVTLQKEAQYLESFINLQSVRYDNVELDIRLDVPQMPEYYIEPMLLIPFVENAFKHGIDNIQSPVIRIHLAVVNDELHFDVANKRSTIELPVRDDAHGLGLVNVEKRLALQYEGKHTLDITKTDWFTIALKISLTRCSAA